MRAGAKPNVLIVEDDSNMAETLGSMVSLLGYQHQISHTSQSALEKAETHPPNIVLLDLNLPDADGFDLLRVLRSRKEMQSIPIIIVSAEGAEHSREKAEEVGADRYLVKPVGIDDLEVAIAEALRS